MRLFINRNVRWGECQETGMGNLRHKRNNRCRDTRQSPINKESKNQSKHTKIQGLDTGCYVYILQSPWVIGILICMHWLCSNLGQMHVIISPCSTAHGCDRPPPKSSLWELKTSLGQPQGRGSSAGQSPFRALLWLGKNMATEPGLRWKLWFWSGLE